MSPVLPGAAQPLYVGHSERFANGLDITPTQPAQAERFRRRVRALGALAPHDLTARAAGRVQYDGGAPPARPRRGSCSGGAALNPHSGEPPQRGQFKSP